MQPVQDAADVPLIDGTFFAELERQVGVRNFANWFQKKTSLQIQDDLVVLGVSSPFLLTWMQRQFRQGVETAAQNALGPSAIVRFRVDPDLVNAEDLLGSVDDHAAPAGGVRAVDDRRRGPRLDDGRTHRRTGAGRKFADLADYIVGDCNDLAYTAAVQAGELPGERVNPVYVHGGVGVGKTHLIEGVYRLIRRQHPSLHVTFITAEAFANYFTRALRERSLPAFRQKFRSVDALILDDVQFLDGKKVIQEEFLHTMKHLVSHGRQVVLAGDRHPRLMSRSGDEFVSHLLSGLVCRIETPSIETRREVVDRKLVRSEAVIQPEARSYVARRFRNMRELEGALNCLETYYRLTRKPVTESRAARVLANLERDCVRIVRMTDVERVVCQAFGVTPEDLKSSSRNRRLTQPRRIAIYLARKLAQAAYSEIGRYFGGRNHSTVLSAEKKVVAELESQCQIQIASREWPLAELIGALEAELQAAG